MQPNFSLVFFTTLAGMSQGLLFYIAIFKSQFNLLSNSFLTNLALPVSFGLLIASLLASFFHLGHPERAWRAAHMWRTSWLSREVIVLPLFITTVILAWYFSAQDKSFPIIWLAIVILAFLLWICTAQIYQCIKFIQEWAHPLTFINFLVLGLTSGWLLFGSLIWLWSDAIENAYVKLIPAIGVALLFIALTIKLTIWKRNRGLKPKSNLNSAIGIPNTKIRQTSMGLMGGSFNTREFFHNQTNLVLDNLRKIILFGAYLFPILILVYALQNSTFSAVFIALIVHLIGLMCERWMFFAEANHPQNLYYQRIS
jgi:DMSO reductase anchor subunit